MKKLDKPPAIDLLMQACKNLGDEVSFELLDNLCGVKGRVSGEGLSLIVIMAAFFLIR